jgi:hypothetical protein
MIQVDMSLINLDQQLKTKLDAATNVVRAEPDLNKKYKYIDAHDDLWRETLGTLAQLTNNTADDCKCWYCESDGTAGFYFQVDHFRPKKRVKNKGYKKGEYEPGYWWLAFNPENYRLSCQRCNTASGKVDQFPLADGSPRAICAGGEKSEKPLLLDPNSDDPKLIMFSQDGDIHPIHDCFDDDRKRVETSIAVFNLRARSKREGRRKVWKECYDCIIDARKARDSLKESLLMPQHEKETKRNAYRDACAKINKMTLRNARFSTTAKSCIREYYKVERARAQSENLEFDLDWLLDLL